MVLRQCAGDLERCLGDLEAMSIAAASGSGSDSGQGTFGLIRSYIAFVKALGQGSKSHAEVISWKDQHALLEFSHACTASTAPVRITMSAGKTVEIVQDTC